MKPRTRPYDSPRRLPAGASISYRGGFLATLDAWLRRAADAVTKIIGARPHGRSHLRLVRRNGRPVPVPLRAVVKTRSPRVGRIVSGILLTLFLIAAGIGGSIYLDLHAVHPTAGMN